ncbi:MAG: lipid A biosynthesis acyltransferase [Bacteroidota bacterium]|nr:lipid A biosynthesis acyltransferase [Bacteroidota bacterium]
MSAWKGQTRGGLTGYRIYIWILRYMGISFAYFILHFVVFYFVFAAPTASREIYRFYRRRMHFNRFKSLVDIYGNYRWFGQILIDKLALLSGFEHKFTFDFEGEEYLRQMANGGLLISAHMGNWEIAGQLLNRLNKTVNIILFDAEHQHIKGLLSKTYKNRNVHFIIIKEDFTHLLEIRDALSRGEIVAMHGDRFIPGNKTVNINFMGEPAPFPIGPVNMAAHFNAPVSFVFAVKESRNHYHFYATPLFKIEQFNNLAKRNMVLTEIVGIYVKKLEEILRKYPLQWFNYYNFWASSGQTLPVKEKP